MQGTHTRFIFGAAVVVMMAAGACSSFGSSNTPNGDPDGGAATADGASPEGSNADGSAAGDGSAACPSLHGPVGVRVGEYCIDATEVTRGQYKEFVDAKKSDMSGQIAQCAGNTAWQPSENFPAKPGEENLPVAHVDWCDAFAFCQWAGKRLCGRIGADAGPNGDSFKTDATKDQWYAACSGGGKTAYPYGASFAAGACQIGGVDAGITHPAEVGSKKTCEGGYSGVFDMVGNVNEWVDVCTSDTTCYSRGGAWFMYDDEALMDCGSAISHPRVGFLFHIGIRCCSP